MNSIMHVARMSVSYNHVRVNEFAFVVIFGIGNISTMKPTTEIENKKLPVMLPVVYVYESATHLICNTI